MYYFHVKSKRNRNMFDGVTTPYRLTQYNIMDNLRNINQSLQPPPPITKTIANIYMVPSLHLYNQLYRWDIAIFPDIIMIIVIGNQVEQNDTRVALEHNMPVGRAVIVSTSLWGLQWRPMDSRSTC